MEGSDAPAPAAAAARKRALPASVTAAGRGSMLSFITKTHKTAGADDAAAHVGKESSSSSSGGGAAVVHTATYNGDPALVPHVLSKDVRVFVAETNEQCIHFCKEIAARKAKAAASGSKIAVGFDIEWTVTFERGHTQRKASLLQLGFSDAVVLFRLLLIHPLPALLFDILCDDTIYKVGVNVAGDASKLERDYSSHFLTDTTGSAAGSAAGVGAGQQQRAHVQGLLDIRHLLRAFRITRTPTSRTLKELAAFYLNCSLPKEASVRQSDWEVAKLTPQQVVYAAVDAHLSLQLYHRVVKIAIEEKFPLLKPAAAAAAAAAVPVDSNASSNSGDSDWRVYVCDVLHNVAKDHVTETLATVQLHTNINGTDIAYAEYASERRRDAQWAIEGEEG